MRVTDEVSDQFCTIMVVCGFFSVFTNCILKTICYMMDVVSCEEDQVDFAGGSERRRRLTFFL